MNGYRLISKVFMSVSQHQDYKLSLPTAILININIMLGAGIFINTSSLAQRAGLLGAFMYLIVGILMLPLILSIVQLLKLHPAGGFYTFAQKEMHPFIGFLSGWSYFTSKLASCMLMIHVSVTLIQSIFPILKAFHPFVLDFIIVCFFSVLNLLNIKSGSSIQKVFIGFKTFPILFVILSGVFVIQEQHFSSNHIVWEGLSSLPLVIYAIIGFEAACSMSSQIKDAKKNAPLAVLISFAIVLCIAMLYQAIFYGALGQMLRQCGGHCDIFPAFIRNIWGDTAFTHKLEGIIHLAIASSTLGAAYGIIFSNSWNLHILAQNNHVWGSKLLTKFNKNLVPYACILIEGALCLVYLFVSQGVLVPLQQIGALGCIIAYTFSVCALFFAIKNKSLVSVSYALPLLGLMSCLILLSACLQSFFINGMSSLLIYLTLLMLGICMFWMTSRKKMLSTSS